MIALISPIRSLGTTLVSKTHMAIAPWVYQRDKRYVDFYRSRAEAGDYVILDNGAFETGQSIVAKDLIEVAESIGAKEIVVPDVFRDRKKSTKLTISSYKKLKDNFGGNLMIVPQGADEADWIEAFAELYDKYGGEPHIIWGIPKWLGEKNSTRANLIGKLPIGPGDPAPTFHALGLSKFAEIHYFKDQMLIRGFDTSMPYVHAYYGHFTTAGTTQATDHARPDDFLTKSFNRAQTDAMYSNIAFMFVNAHENLWIQ